MIQVENLTKYYNDFCAVNGISLTINKGEILGLLGPNGAGKTTTLRMLTGFFQPTSGSIRVNDLSIPRDLLKIKGLMGYLPESAPLYHNMLVYDYLDFVARIKGIPAVRRLGRMKELADLCGLGQIMHQPIEDLSKGLKQRVGLAHALMSDPEILILDEPTSGLDPNQIAEIRAIIRKIGKEKTIIFSTHILSEAESTSDRIVIIHNGTIVADDTTDNLKHSAAQGACVRLSLAEADADAAGALLRSVCPGADIRPRDNSPATGGAVAFEIRGNVGDDQIRAMYLGIRETDWIITGLSRDTQSLETIFQNLTREK
ncbi:MAG: ABC transporter ATP-binding protein [Pseudomonadota bacterium]